MAPAHAHGRAAPPGSRGLSGTRVEAALAHIAESEGVSGLERAFLDIAPTVMDSGAHGIYMLDEATKVLSVRVAHLPPGFVDAYEDLGRANDVLFRHIAAHGMPIHDRALCTPSSWPKEPIGSFLGEWGFSHTLYAPVCAGGVLQGTLHFGRTRPGHPFRQADLQVAMLVARQVAQQLRWIRTEHELTRMQGLCSALLERIDVPAVVTTEAGALVEANAAAVAMLVCYRDGPQLWDEYTNAVRRNAASIAVHGGDCGGTATVRHDRRAVTYLVRTTSAAGSDLLLSLFHAQVHGPTARGELAGRDQVIACLIASGYTNDRIATALDLSVNTVKDRVKLINRRLGTTNRAQIAAWAQRHLSPSTAG